MTITREQVAARLAQLQKERAAAEQVVQQAHANVNAYQGAIQDCEYWLRALDAEADAGEQVQ